MAYRVVWNVWLGARVRPDMDPSDCFTGVWDNGVVTLLALLRFRLCLVLIIRFVLRWRVSVRLRVRMRLLWCRLSRGWWDLLRWLRL